MGTTVQAGSHIGETLVVKAAILAQLSKSQPLSNGTLEAARKQAEAASDQASKAPEKAGEIKQVRPAK